MARFEKITIIDGYEVTFLTSYNNMAVYKNKNTGDSDTLWLVVNGQVIFSFYQENKELFVAEEFMSL